MKDAVKAGNVAAEVAVPSIIWERVINSKNLDAYIHKKLTYCYIRIDDTREHDYFLHLIINDWRLQFLRSNIAN